MQKKKKVGVLDSIALISAEHIRWIPSQGVAELVNYKHTLIWFVLCGAVRQAQVLEACFWLDMLHSLTGGLHLDEKRKKNETMDFVFDIWVSDLNVIMI